MVDNIIYSSKFPNPPKFSSFPNKGIFEVPKYYGFDHPCTKWILGSIVSNQALLRLLKVASIHKSVMKRYHQIPDRPSLIMKNKYNVERAAFNSQAILYLTPLTLAIYMKYDDALSQLVTLKDAEGRTVVDTGCVCFVQNFWRKGESRYFTDLITTFPAIVAIRRNYPEAFTYLLMAGYRPNNSFSLTYRKPHREITIVYKDLIDYVIDYLKSRPAFNVGRLMHILLHSTNECDNILDIFCFDYLPASKQVISLFQRVARMAIDEDNIPEENGMHIINVLEKIQEFGFFQGLPNMQVKTQVELKELKDVLKDNMTHKISVLDWQSIKEDERNLLMETDHKNCISNIIVWLRTRSLNRKTEQNIHLLNLLTKILFDTKHIELFFKGETKSVDQLTEKLEIFFNLPEQLDKKSVLMIREHIVHVFHQSEPMIAAFISRYKMEPNDAFLISGEASYRLMQDNKFSWIKSQLAESSFRQKYLNEKEKKVKVQRGENEDKEFVPLNTIENQNNAQTIISRKDYFYVSAKSKKTRSFSTNNSFKNPEGIIDKSPDVTIKSFQSFDTKDRSDSFSTSSNGDLDQLTMIEIDLTNEVRTSKKTFTEVLISEDDDLNGMGSYSSEHQILIQSSFDFNKFTSSPPPLNYHHNAKVSK